MREKGNPITESAIILPFPELSPMVDVWRTASVDVAEKGVPPHITLLYPWRSGAVSRADIDLVVQACQKTARFIVLFNCVDYFSGGAVYLGLEDNRDVLALMQSIWQVFPESPPYAGQHDGSIPHLTIAQTNPASVSVDSGEISQALEAELPVTANVDHVAIISQDSNGWWHELTSIELG